MIQPIWNWVLTNVEGGVITVPELDKYNSISLTHLIGKGYLVRESTTTFKLTDKGLQMKKELEDKLDVLRKGIPLLPSRKLVPKVKLLKRGFRSTAWYRGKLKNKKTFISDRGILIGGNNLLLRSALYIDDVPIFFLPASKDMRETADKLITNIYPLKREPLTPFCYQRVSLIDNGVIWFKQIITKELFAMSALYYDYLLTYSGRIEFEYTISSSFYLNKHHFFVVTTPHAAHKYKLCGDMIALVAPVTREGPTI